MGVFKLALAGSFEGITRMQPLGLARCNQLRLRLYRLCGQISVMKTLEAADVFYAKMKHHGVVQVFLQRFYIG